MALTLKLRDAFGHNMPSAMAARGRDRGSHAGNPHTDVVMPQT